MQVMLDGCQEKHRIQLTCFISNTCTLQRRKTNSLSNTEADTGGVLYKRMLKSIGPTAL